ncbi:MAG: ROK family protein [Acidobacteria bacterium]|nr:ROK family protein [Acidobacteriota bacterium]
MATWIGLDIGGTTVKAGRVNEAGVIVARGEEAAPDELGALTSVCGSLIESVWANDVEGVGIGCRGIIDVDAVQVIVSPGRLRCLDGYRLSELAPAGVRVAADNDARAAAAGEMVWGAARGKRHAIMLTLGTGMGGAIVADGKMIRGSAWAAGHLGHLNVDPNGPMCVCGARGCIETYVSARAIESEAWAAVHRGTDTLLNTRGTDCATVFACAAEGDKCAAGIVSGMITRLGGFIGGLIFAFDPEIVILGGSVSLAGDALFGPLQRDVDARIGPFFRRSVEIARPGVGDPTGIIGAAALVRLQ